MRSLDRILLDLGRGALLFGFLVVPTFLVAPGPGETLPLRWLRKLAEHPVRGTFALALALSALNGASRRPMDRSNAPERLE